MFVVAGASGRTGMRVAEALLSQGRGVRALVRDPAKGVVLEEHGAEIHRTDLADAAALAAVLEGASGFYAILPEDLSASDFHGHRRKMADAMAKALDTSATPHAVLLSAGVATRSDGNGPARDLYYAEQALRSSSATLTTLRAPFFQENVLSAAPAARERGIYPSFFASADVTIPTVATRDVAGLAVRMLTSPASSSRVVDVVGPSYSVHEMATQLGAVLGKSLEVVTIPPAAQIQTLVGAGLPEAFASALAELFACLSSGDVTPEGDQTERCGTPLAEVLGEALGGGGGSARE